MRKWWMNGGVMTTSGSRVLVDEMTTSGCRVLVVEKAMEMNGAAEVECSGGVKFQAGTAPASIAPTWARVAQALGRAGYILPLPS